MACNFARRLKTLKGLTPYEYICKIWAKEPERFTIKPATHIVELNNWLSMSLLPQLAHVIRRDPMKFRVLISSFMSIFFVVAVQSGSALGQGFPTKPVRFVVPFPAGGSVDMVARVLGQKLSSTWGQQILVDNRAGANGTIATGYVAKSAPDGYTILMAFSSHAINPNLYENLPYDAQRDFAPITQIASVPNILVVHPSLPVKSVKELIALAKANPSRISYASSGSGSPAHISAELFKEMAGVDLLHVAYKGGPPHIISVISGETGLVFTTVFLALPHVKSGKMRAIAVTSLKRSGVLPEVPTVSDTLPGYESGSWYGMLGPAAIPKNLVELLHGDVVRVLQMPDVREYLLSQGAEPIGNKPEEFSLLIANEIVKWGKLLKAKGAKAN